jgi:hypothetical protein
MNFSDALISVKAGNRIARKTWNGKNMFIVYQPGYPKGISINENTQKAFNLPAGSILAFKPYLTMYTAQGDCVPWVASQSDLLEDDWYILE